VIVVGQSLGTQVAELVAAQHPDRVAGLVLLTPVPLGGTQLPDEVIAPFGALGGDRVAQQSLRRDLAPNLGEEQLDRLADIGAPVTSDVVSHYVDVWNDGLSHAPAISAFAGSVLIIGGGADAFSTQEVVNAVSQRFADADVKTIEKGGHWIHFEYPGAVAAMVLDFADAIGRVTP
jgi:pimeloyl-ACP methyl ester carboxylesterase